MVRLGGDGAARHAERVRTPRTREQFLTERRGARPGEHRLDESEEEHNLSKARRVLGWEPQSQKFLLSDPLSDHAS